MYLSWNFKSAIWNGRKAESNLQILCIMKWGTSSHNEDKQLYNICMILFSCNMRQDTRSWLAYCLCREFCFLFPHHLVGFSKPRAGHTVLSKFSYIILGNVRQPRSPVQIQPDTGDFCFCDCPGGVSLGWYTYAQSKTPIQALTTEFNWPLSPEILASPQNIYCASTMSQPPG